MGLLTIPTIQRSSTFERLCWVVLFLYQEESGRHLCEAFSFHHMYCKRMSIGTSIIAIQRFRISTEKAAQLLYALCCSFVVRDM